MLNSLWKRLWVEEDGLGMVEIVVIIAVIVVLALTFRKQIKEFLIGLFKQVDTEKNKIFDYKP